MTALGPTTADGAPAFGAPGSGIPGSGALRYDVFRSGSLPLALPDLLPNGSGRTWAPLSSTLVSGAEEAVLIDPPLTTLQALAVGDRMEAIGKRLTHIVVTHGHGDRWFTAAMLTDRFPGARVVATAGTIRQMHRAADARAGFWDRMLPGHIPPSPVTAEPGHLVLLEGHALDIVEVGHSDTDDTSVVHVPNLGLVVAGDVVYNGVHQFLVESGDSGRDAWRTAIDAVETLHPRSIVAGHTIQGRDEDPTRLITATRQYLDDVDDLLGQLTTPVQFFEEMLRRHPDHLNASTLWGSALALYAGR